MLAHGVHTVTSEGKEILLPAFAEDDYAPIGPWRNLDLLPLGSTWIEVELDPQQHSWSDDPTSEGNRKRSDIVRTSLRSGRWWSYWTHSPIVPWIAGRTYPRLSLMTDRAAGTVTVWYTGRDLVLPELRFIGAPGDSFPLKTAADLRPNERITYHCRPADKYVRVMAEYCRVGFDPNNPDPNNSLLRIASNAIWINPSVG
jgi:hypothetical protein